MTVSKSILYVVCTVGTFFKTEYFGDVLLITTNKEEADRLVTNFNEGKEIPGLNRELLADNDGKAVCFIRTLNETINNEV